ncbi:MAG: hypothetical protein ACE1Y4_18905, partial [Lysobacterales bacterium]
LDGEALGAVTPLDVHANNRRQRQRPPRQRPSRHQAATEAQQANATPPPEHNLIEQILRRQSDFLTRQYKATYPMQPAKHKKTPKT